MVLEKLIGLEQKNSTMLAAIQKSVNQLVAEQAKGNKQAYKAQREAQGKARVAKSDKTRKEGLMGALTGGKKPDKKKGGGLLQAIFGGLGGMASGIGGALAGALALPIAIKAGAVLIGGALVFALTNKKVREALFDALKWAFDALRKTSGKVANHAWHGFLSLIHI